MQTTYQIQTGPDGIQEIKNKYFQHKASAKCRGIPFNLSFEEWYDIWLKSGHWHERGLGKNKYCMSRYNDEGAYEVGNVFIQTNSGNGKDQKGKSKPTPWLIGKKQSELTKLKRKETIKNIATDYWTGKQMSQESSDKKSIALKGKPWSEARRLSHLKRKLNENNI